MKPYEIFIEMRKLPKGYIIDNPYDLVETDFTISDQLILNDPEKIHIGNFPNRFLISKNVLFQKLKTSLGNGILPISTTPKGIGGSGPIFCS